MFESLEDLSRSSVLTLQPRARARAAGCRAGRRSPPRPESAGSRVDDAGAGTEEADGLLRDERLDVVLLLGCDAKRLAAGDEDPQTPAVRQQIGELRRGVEELLEIVQKKEELLLGDVLRQLALRAQHLGDRVHHERGVANRGERDPPDAAREALADLGGRLSREPRLPRSPGAVSVSIRLVEGARPPRRARAHGR